jgi:hypothetical protein
MNYFTVIYKHECLYSIKARLLRDSLYNQIDGASLTYLGGFRRNPIDLELPCYIKELVDDTKQFVSWSIESAILDHTNFPLYRVFVLPEKHLPIMNSMAGSRTDVHAIVGLKSSSLVRSRFPQFCPLCCEDDIKEFGETFFRRIHQVPNIQICPDHDCLLIEYNPQIGELEGAKYFYLTRDKINKLAVSLNSCNILKEIALEFNSLMQNDYKFNYREINYRDLFESLGYFRNGFLQRKDLNDQFKRFYQEVKNEYLLSRIAESYTWIGDLILNPDRILNPFQHVLFRRFADSLDLKISTEKSHPFGNGPWVCFNKVCVHYLKEVITDVKIEINKDRSRLVGIFSCTCGMIYTKIYPKVKDGYSEQFKIKTRGELWLNVLDKCIAENLTVRETARKLGTNNSVVIKYIKRKSLSKVIKAKRTEWRKVLKIMPYSQARIKESSLYKWLFRNDRDWLLSTRSKEKVANPRQLRINWNEVDDQLYAEISTAVDKIKRTKSRVSRQLISRLTKNGKYIHGTDLKKLPRSKALLKKTVESTEEHQLRRIQYAIIELSDQGRLLSRSNILRTARVKNPSIRILSEIGRNL